MGTCCGPDGACEVPKGGAGACPRCGAAGRAVGDETVEAILQPGAAARMLAVERRFCATPGCPVLYYGADGRIAEKAEARVRVGVKETEDPVPLCYCFGYTRADVRREVAEAGESGIPDRITAEVRAGRCECERKNPSGACCLGEVRQAVRREKEALGAEKRGGRRAAASGAGAGRRR